MFDAPSNKTRSVRLFFSFYCPRYGFYTTDIKLEILFTPCAKCFEQYFTPNTSTGTFNEDAMMLIIGRPFIVAKYLKKKIKNTSAWAITSLMVLVR